MEKEGTEELVQSQGSGARMTAFISIIPYSRLGHLGKVPKSPSLSLPHPVHHKGAESTCFKRLC